MMDIVQRYSKIQQRINTAEQQYQRQPNSVQLLVVSKSRSTDEIQKIINLGQKSFGENYVQEALPKIQALAKKNIEWHFIGPIQSNKTKSIAENFAWAHSIDRIKIANRLNDQRPADFPPLHVCIEVNINDETSKSGVATKESLIALAQTIKTLPRLKLRGLMAIPEYSKNFLIQQKMFKKLLNYFDTLNNKGFQLDTLSMGMSDDFEAAISQGSTMVRIGTAIFGPRT